MPDETRGEAPPSTAWQLGSPAALALADLAAIFDDMQFVLRCCEQLITELARGDERDDVRVEALWFAALSSYARCFRPGERGMGLTEKDLQETGLKGEVVKWHELLGRLRDFFVDGTVNPREAFSVGVTQSAEGEADGIVITSVPRPLVDDTTVQQVGRLAFELSRVVDERIKTQQETVFTAAKEMSTSDLGELVPIEVVLPAVESV